LRNYAPLHETRRQLDEQQTAAASSREPRNYDGLRTTQQRVDRDTEAERPDLSSIQRGWTHRGGMVPQQHSANVWNRQNIEIKMSERGESGAGRDGEQQQHSENDPGLQEARAAVEEARRREAAERARLQERERSGPER
jgi:hypothetical protein